MKVLVLGLVLLLGQFSSTTAATTASSNTTNSSTTASSSVMSTSSTNSMGGGASSMGGGSGGAAGNVNYMVGMTTKSGQSHPLAPVSLLLASLGLHTLWQ